jgi:hypothetical protein
LPLNKKEVIMFDKVEDIPLELELEFKKNGQRYCQIKRNNKAVIYSQKNEVGRMIGYEVWKIKIQKAFAFTNYQYPSKERIPGNNDFGKWAWSVGTLDRAEEILELLTHNKPVTRK